MARELAAVLALLGQRDQFYAKALEGSQATFDFV